VDWVIGFVLGNRSPERSIACLPVSVSDIRRYKLVEGLVNVAAFVEDILELVLTGHPGRELVVALELDRGALQLLLV